MNLSAAQVRVVGCLLEKELTTPDNYPLSMNGLLAACNQTSNRNPVVTYDERIVGNAIENLRAQGLLRVVYSRSNRVDKYRHVLDEVLGIDVPDRALLAVLMVRGPQTAAELRARTERSHAFEDEASLEATLQRLAQREEPLVTRLDRRPGHRQERWAHLLGGPVADTALADTTAGVVPGDDRPLARPADDAPADGVTTDGVATLVARIDALEAEVARLRAEQEALADRLRPLVD